MPVTGGEDPAQDRIWHVRAVMAASAPCGIGAEDIQLWYADKTIALFHLCRRVFLKDLRQNLTGRASDATVCPLQVSVLAVPLQALLGRCIAVLSAPLIGRRT